MPASALRVSAEASPYARVFGEELQQSLERTIDHYAARFPLGEGSEADQWLNRHEACRRLAHLRAAAGEAGQEGADSSEAQFDDFRRFAGRCEAFLEQLARRYGHPHRPIVDPS